MLVLVQSHRFLLGLVLNHSLICNSTQWHHNIRNANKWGKNRFSQRIVMCSVLSCRSLSWQYILVWCFFTNITNCATSDQLSIIYEYFDRSVSITMQTYEKLSYFNTQPPFCYTCFQSCTQCRFAWYAESWMSPEAKPRFLLELLHSAYVVANKYPLKVESRSHFWYCKLYLIIESKFI